MPINTTRTLPGFFALALLMIVVSAVSARFAAPAPTIDWFTIDGGGGKSTGGTFELNGTIGQPDAGGPMTGGTFSLTGGFWAGATPANDCPADINHDNNVNVADLLSVISGWGSCPSPCPPRCAADVSPAATGDCQVNVADLLAVISSWGACP